MITTHRAAVTVLLVVSLAAAGAPMAGARPADFTPAGKHAPAAVYSRQDKSLIPVTPPATSGGAATAANKATAPQTAVRVHAAQSGFDWGDAAIGAVGGLALSLIGLGGALGVSHRRARRTVRTAALTG